MITKYLRKRNLNQDLPFTKNSARIEVHSNGSNTFKFVKTLTPVIGAGRLLTEASLYLNTELGQRIQIG